MIKKLSIDSLVSGMILDDPVRDQHGRILLPRRHVITDKTLEMVRQWGITEVTIIEEDQAVSAEQAELAAQPLLNSEAAVYADMLFKHTNKQSPFVKELYRLAAQYNVKIKAKNASSV